MCDLPKVQGERPLLRVIAVTIDKVKTILRKTVVQSFRSGKGNTAVVTAEATAGLFFLHCQYLRQDMRAEFKCMSHRTQMHELSHYQGKIALNE